MAEDQKATNDDSIFDDAERLFALAEKSFAKAVRDAIEENDRLGLPSPGGIGGKVVWRYPPRPT